MYRQNKLILSQNIANLAEFGPKSHEKELNWTIIEPESKSFGLKYC